MPIGYLVTLGNGSLDTGDAISGTQSNFTTDRILGAGDWTWTGVWDGDGQTYSNIYDTGTYQLGTDGNVYFVPDTWYITSGSATAGAVPTYTPDGTIDGTAGADTISDGYIDADNEQAGGDDTIAAGAGNDTVFGGAGNDKIDGGRDNDSVDGGVGNDTLFGGQGDDTLAGNDGFDQLYGGDGNDSLNSGNGFDTIYGGSGNDRIDGGNSADTVYGGLGNDTITDIGGDQSADVIYGGSGLDSIDAGQGSDFVYGGSGTDTLSGGAGTDTIQGGGDGDIIYGGDGNDVIDGDSSATGTAGSANLSWLAEGPSGTQLDSTVVQSTGGMNIEVQVTDDGNASTMQVSGSTQYTEAGEPFATNSALQLGGGAGPTSTATFAFEANPNSGLSDEVQNVSFRINDIDQNGWQDIITVNAYDADGNLVPVNITIGDPFAPAPDTVSGNTITAGNQPDNPSDAAGSALIDIAGPVQSVEIIYSNGGTVGQALWITDVHFDTALASDTGGQDTIFGGAGDDSIFGNDRVDTLYGGDGNDTLDGGENTDFIYGGAGDDLIIETGGSLSDDSIYGGDGNDSIDGGDREDLLSGDAGNDTIEGAAGTDTILGGQGADTLSGGADADTIYGDSISIDPADYAATAGGNATNLTVVNQADGPLDLYWIDGTGTLALYATILPGGSHVQGTFDNHYWVLTDENGQIVQLIEGGTNQTVTYGATSLNDSIDGGVGNDTIDGQFGDDSISGSAGDDIVYGGSGSDTIDGGTENDLVYGGDGADSVLGGAGDDVIYGGNAGTDANLIVNGSFEDLSGTTATGYGAVGVGSVTGWTDYTGGDLDLHNDGKGGTFATDGSYVLDMGGSPSNLHIYQDVQNVVEGETYVLSFDAGDVTGGGNSVNVYWGGVLIGNVDPVEGGMESFTFDLIGGAGDGSNRLEFEEIGPIDSDGIQLDDVQLIGPDASSTTADVSDDTLSGGTGNDVVFGEDGNDTIGDWSTEDGNDTFYGGAGNDSLNGGAGDDSLYGGVGADTLSGAYGNDLLFGGEGSDQFWITDDHEGDTITGGEDLGNGDWDSVWFSNWISTQGVSVTATGDEAGTYDFAGSPATGSFSEIEAVGGTNFDDTLNMSADTTGMGIYGGQGADTITGGSGNNYIDLGSNGGVGDGDADVIVLTDGFGADTVVNFDAPTPNGDGTFTGIDTFDVTGLLDAGGLPVDTNDVTVGNDGSGNAVLTFPNGETVTLNGIAEATANDPFWLNAIGIPLPDGTVSGTAGNDVIDGSYVDPTDGDRVDSGDALIAGHGANDDLIEAGAGNDTIDGGLGSDTIYAGTGADTIYGGADAASNTIFGEAGDDLAFGGSGNDAIYGGADNDNLDGEAGNDSLYGGTGNDQLIGDAGSDTLFGGDGADTFYGGLDADTIYGGDGNDTAFGAEGNDVMELWLGNDTAYGGDNDDYIDGAQGDDVLFGDAGNDTLLGGSDAGQDTLFGGTGNDSLSAGDGNDVLDGGTGDDTQFGAGGDDIFLLADGFGTDTITGGETTETFGDFLDASAVTTDLTLDLSTLQPSNPEMGTLTDGTNTATFEEIEYVFLGTGNDSVTGSSGADQVATNLGQDTINLGAGDDQLDLGQSGGGGDFEADVIILQDGSGNDTILNFDAPTANGDGTFTGIDTFDVTNLHDAGGDPVTVDDVTVSDDGSGNALLSFPNGESVTLVGISPLAAADLNYLNAIGIPFRDGTVEGTSGNDTIGLSYTGDPDGDMVDAGDAILPGDTGDDDLIYAYGGDDNIYSGAGNDEVYGGAGNDVIDNGAGNSTLFGGDDNDSIYSGNGDDTVYGGAGDDVVFASIGADEIYGGDGNDTMSAGGFAGTGDTMDGGAGNDTISGGLGNDTAFGGTGDDLINISSSGGTDSVLGGEDVDGLDIDTLNFDDGTGPDGVDVTLSGDEAGAYNFPTTTTSGTFDEIEAFDLTDQADTFNGVLSNASATVFGGAGTDTITGTLDADTLYGGADADRLLGDAGADEIYGDAGADSLSGGDGADSLYGGTENDTISGGSGNDTIFGGDGNDSLTGGSNSDTVYGGAGDDTITDSFTAATMYGGDGADTINVGYGSSSVVGGEGGTDLDTLSFAVADDTVNITLTGAEAGSYADNDFDNGTFSEIERFEMTSGADTFDGSAATSGDHTVEGGAGDDTITGGGGNDTLLGGADQDTFLVQDGFGNDTVIGGQTGNNYDTLDLSALSNPVSVLFTGPGAGTVTDTVTGDVITFSEIEQLILTNQSDVVNAGADNGYTYIQTRDGNDSYVGSDGDDIVDDEIGAANGQGNDTFYGGAGNDEIWAGTDDDIIFGGTGADSLNGQEGNDTITFAEGDTASGGSGDDLFILEDLGEPTNGTITIDGGSTGETGGDTLQLGSLATLTPAVRDTFVDDGTGSFSGSVTLDDGTILNFSEIENIICFTPGTSIATPHGLRNIEDLAVGDLVVTRDHGLQPIRWIESRTVPAVERFAPVTIRPGVLAGLEKELVVSPQHRVLFQGYRAELLFGESEVLVAAKHLIDGHDVTQDEGSVVTYIHMMFDQHEVIYAQGAATESFHPGDIGFSAVGDEAREELFAIFPELRADQSAYGNTARRCLKAHEAKLVRT